MQSIRSLLRDASPAPLAQFARKVLIWKRNAAFRAYVTSKNIHGESFQFYVGDQTAKSWYEGDHHEWWVEIPFLLDRMVSSGDSVFEVGSHHGFHLIPMARRAKRVIAIEPHPHNVSILQRNVALNSLGNVSVRQAAIGDSTGKITLLQDTNDGGVSAESTRDRPTISVDLLPLDRLADEYGFPQLLKIDVEGFETQVLRGAPRIMRRRPKIAIEVHTDWISRYGSSVGELLDLLHLDDYQVWFLGGPGAQVSAWNGEDFTTSSAPKFHLYLVPRKDAGAAFPAQ